MQMGERILLAVLIAMSFQVAQARAEFSQGYLAKLLRNKIESAQDLAANEAVMRAVLRQNERNASLEEIGEIDKEWTSTKEFTPFKESLQENEIGRFFKTLVTFEHATYSEIILTDRQGANVATYPTTTDYWQGDERKWIEAFEDGGKVYIGPVTFDESTEMDSVQVSVPVMADGKPIGVLIVGIKLTWLQGKYLKDRQ